MMVELFCLLYHVLQTTKQAVPLVRLLVQVAVVEVEEEVEVGEEEPQVNLFMRVYHVYHMGGY